MAKIIRHAYPEEYKLMTKNARNINAVFQWRVNAYIRDYVKYICFVYGLRTLVEQKQLYDLYLKGQGNLAAPPGESWHNFGLAMDFNSNPPGSGIYPGTINKDFELWTQGKESILNRYGLCHRLKTEPWHIQPIETAGYTGDKSKYLDPDDYTLEEVIMIKRGDTGERVKNWQRIAQGLGYNIGSAGVTGDFGLHLENVTKLIQKNYKQKETGAVDEDLLLMAGAGLSENIHQSLSKIAELSSVSESLNKEILHHSEELNSLRIQMKLNESRVNDSNVVREAFVRWIKGE